MVRTSSQRTQRGVDAAAGYRHCAATRGNRSERSCQPTRSCVFDGDVTRYAADATDDPDVDDVLVGTRPYDSLNEDQQAVVRAVWDERIKQHLATIDLVAEFDGRGQSYVVVDDDGRIVKRRPGRDPVVLTQPTDQLLLEQLKAAATRARARMLDADASSDERAAARRELVDLATRLTDLQFGDVLRSFEVR